ncbi:MAG: hypothetical protein Tsb0021_14340 [Chlamydiales bacterium]
MFVFFRNPVTKSAEFIDFNQLLHEETSSKRLIEVFQSINDHVYAYDPIQFNKLKFPSDNLYLKITEKLSEEQKILNQKTKSLFFTIFTLGIYRTIKSKLYSEKLARIHKLHQNMHKSMLLF